jgi:cytochrome c oxidase subunit 2
MREKTFLAIVGLTGLIMAAGTSSCCLNCPNPPAGGRPAYSDENPPDLPRGGEFGYMSSNFESPLSGQPSGEVVNGIRVIKMTAKRYEYDPSVITVDQGDKVRLEITSQDVTHGFGLKEYKINRKLEPGKTEIIEFTADKAGTFEFRCTVFCGIGHLGMKGKLVVLPK